MKKKLLTTVYQTEVKVLDPADAPDTYERNLPPGGRDKWELVEYPNRERAWVPKHKHTFTTPKINDHNKINLEVQE